MLPEALRPVWAEINMAHARHNICQIIQRASGSAVMGIIKADAYGHGAVRYAKVLLEHGVHTFGVAVLREAIILRESGITHPIVLLSLTPDMYLQTVLDYNLTPVISTYQNAKALSDLIEKQANAAHRNTIVVSDYSSQAFSPDQAVQAGVFDYSGQAIDHDQTDMAGEPCYPPEPCHSILPKEIFIAVDTGMGRVGFQPDEAGIHMIKQISQLPHLKLQALFSHFACADEADKASAKKQLAHFNRVYETLHEQGVRIPVRTIANSAGVIDLPESHFEMVRPGILLYGCYPSCDVQKENMTLKPVMSIKANITLLKTVPPGTAISYGSTFITKRASVIATLPLGYADGYPRCLTGKARVIVRGQYAPVVGRICMDQCMVDVTDVTGAQEGDEVILLGSDGHLNISAEEWGEKTQSISYEILSRIGQRIPRVYV